MCFTLEISLVGYFHLKKILNDANEVVNEELEGIELLYSRVLRRIPNTNVIVRKDAPKLGKASVVSGGGSGHEPLHWGFVGKGILDAAIAGEVFTAPTPDQIYAAIKEVNGAKGVLLIINNYSGDIMNFKLAEELAIEDGIEVKHVIVNDDVAVLAKEKRRGVAGGIFIEKIAGAKAETGANLDDVLSLTERAISNTRSMGVALTSCTLPRMGSPMFQIGEDEMELGIGVHGEKGIERMKLKSADEIASLLFDRVSKDLDLRTGDEVALLVNGMGGTPMMELLIFSRAVLRLLQYADVKIFRSIVGSFVTSLDMAGVSLSLIRVDDEMKELLLSPDTTPSFPKIV